MSRKKPPLGLGKSSSWGPAPPPGYFTIRKTSVGWSQAGERNYRNSLKSYAGGGTRTRKGLLPEVFETSASATSATPAAPHRQLRP